MKSPAGSAQEPRGHADHHGSARPAGGFTTPAPSCNGQRGGDGRSAAAGTGSPAAALSTTLSTTNSTRNSGSYPTTVADVADRIVSLRAAWPPPAPDVCGSRPSWRPARARPGRVPRTGPHSSGGTKTPTTASDAARRPGRSTGCSVLNQESACPWSAPDEPAPGTARPTPCRSASPQRPAGRRQPPAPPAPRTAAAARRRPPDPTPPPPPAPTTESPPRPLLSPDPAVLVEDAPAVTVDPSC